MFEKGLQAIVASETILPTKPLKNETLQIRIVNINRLRNNEKLSIVSKANKSFVL